MSAAQLLKPHHFKMQTMRFVAWRILYGLSAILLLLPISGCHKIQTSQDAQMAGIAKGIVQPVSPEKVELFRTEFGLNALRRINVVSASNQCEGAAGSIISPMAFVECGATITTLPINIFFETLIES